MSDDPKNPFPTKGESRSTFEGNRFGDEHLQRAHTQLLREKEEPTENFSPMPLFLVGLFMVLAFWAGVYIVHYSGDFGPFHYDETVRAGQAEDTGPVEVDMIALGKRIYSQNCVACHQSDGNGLPGVYPTLVDSEWVDDHPDRLVNIILAGLAGPVVVKGNEYNNAMTAFGRLKDQEIAAVLTYIRTDPAFQNDSFEVSPEEVARVRSEYGERTDPWTQKELDAIYGPPVGGWQPEASASEEETDGEESSEAETESSEETATESV